MIRARLHLGDEPAHQELHAHHQQHDCREEQRSIRNPFVMDVLHVRQPHAEQRSERAHPEPEEAEDLQRPRRIADQELDGEEIEHHPDGARDAVLRRAVDAPAVVDDVLGDRDAHLAGDRRQEPVHLAVQLHRLHDLGAKHLQRAAIIVELHAGHLRDDPVGNHRRQPAADESVLSVPAPPGDDVEPLRELDHGGDVPWIVLEIAIGRDDETAARVREPGGEARGLSEVAPEADDAQPRITHLERRQPIERLIRTAVVDDNDLVAAPEALERCRELFVQRRHVQRLVADRDDDRNIRIHRFWRDHKRLIIGGFR